MRVCAITNVYNTNESFNRSAELYVVPEAFADVF